MSAHAVAPANDDIANAVEVMSLPFDTRIDVSEATRAEGDSACATSTVWYALTPVTDGTYLFGVGTSAEMFTVMLSVYEGSPGSLAPVSTCNFYNARVDLSAGTTYYIEVGGELGGPVASPGDFLAVSIQEAPPPLEVNVEVTQARVGEHPGTVIVMGTVGCNKEAEFLTVYGEVRQRQGLNVAVASYYLAVGCSPVLTTWTATATGGNRVFLPKVASITVWARACDIDSCDEDYADASIKLRR